MHMRCVTRQQPAAVRTCKRRTCLLPETVATCLLDDGVGNASWRLYTDLQADFGARLSVVPPVCTLFKLQYCSTVCAELLASAAQKEGWFQSAQAVVILT